MISHDDLCPNVPCDCEPDEYGHMMDCSIYCLCDLINKVREETEQRTIAKLLTQDRQIIENGHLPECSVPWIRECICNELSMAYERGYKEAEQFYTNECMQCGYAGEWSTWMCDECERKYGEKEKDN